jgi:mono/diheme cytochrome c family protein
VLALLAYFSGAGLEPPADPTDVAYVPLPEWYFLPFFQLLKLVPGSMEAAVAVGLPGALLLALLLLPFFDRRSIRSLRSRPVAAFSMFALLGGSGLLLGESMREYVAGAPEIGPPLTAVERSGRALFKRQQCGSCHQVGKQKVEKKDPDAPDAPELTEVGLKHTQAWMHSFIEEPLRFHADSKMPAFGPPLLTHMEIEELAQYLATLRGPNGSKKQPEFRDTFPEPVKPKEKP